MSVLRALLRFATVAAAISSASFASDSPAIIEADVCVDGGTSGGVMATVQAARMGKNAVIAEPGDHLGGMTAGGLSAVDIGDPRTVGGLARDETQRVGLPRDELTGDCGWPHRLYSVQKVDYSALRTQLEKDGQILIWRPQP